MSHQIQQLHQDNMEMCDAKWKGKNKKQLTVEESRGRSVCMLYAKQRIEIINIMWRHIS